MRKTDYSSIAAEYDRNPSRRKPCADPDLSDLINEVKKGTGRPVRALDLACGTGTWLSVQNEVFGQKIALFGADASEAMLRICSEKVPEIPVTHAWAENLPFAAGSFEFIVCNFAFHHFSDKYTALDEIARILSPGGIFKYTNIAPFDSPEWWIYRYFPRAREYDSERFWPERDLIQGLKTRGINLLRQDEPPILLQISLKGVLNEARNRDTSQLAILDEEDYDRGIRRLEHDFDTNPEGQIGLGLKLSSLVFRFAPAGQQEGGS